MRRFSAARSMAGGSPETMEAMVLEYSDEENSRERVDTAGLKPASTETLSGLMRYLIGPGG